jgi:4-hydroxymandelate oxidase
VNDLPINVSEYEPLARAAMDPFGWAFYSTGADDEVTLRENRAAFERIRLRPRVLVDASRCDLRTTLLGTPASMPICVAPTAAHGLAHPDAECATARGAGAAGSLMTASSESMRSLEQIAQAATGPLWFQLYMYAAQRPLAEQFVRRAAAAGYRAVVLTVDAPTWGHRERTLRVESGPWPAAGNFPEAFDFQPYAPTWGDVDWLRGVTDLPVVLKGILTAEDAALAVQRGAAGIVVSNHGGRQLDGVAATIEALPEVVAAVAGRCEVYLDGGVRRGTDVLKALALGARAVFVGRPVLWGLAARGEEGVRHVLDLLRAELERAMVLAGRPALAAIDRSLVSMPAVDGRPAETRAFERTE